MAQPLLNQRDKISKKLERNLDAFLPPSGGCANFLLASGDFFCLCTLKIFNFNFIFF